MPLLSRTRDERGFTMVIVVAAMFVVMGVSIAALSAAQGDLPVGKHDQDRKVAYAAAEAGMQEYLFHLVDDTNYWAKCTAVGAPVNDPWDGVSARRWASVPGSRARYTIELLPANGNAKCLSSNPDATMIDSATGTFRIRVTGQALHADGVTGPKRTIVANLKRQSLLDFIYFTDKEDLDPSLLSIYSGGYPTDQDPSSAVSDVTQWGRSACSRYYGTDATVGNRAGQTFNGATGAAQTGLNYPAGSSSWYKYSLNCLEIQFAGADVIKGPLHTNDEIYCSGATHFGRSPGDRIEVASTGETGAAPSGYRDSACNPYVNFGTSTAKSDAGTWKAKADGAQKLQLPPSNSSLKRDTDPAYRFVGNTKIVMNGANMTVTGQLENGTTYNANTIPLPADGVLYVANSPTQPCSSYNPIDAYNVQAGCGNLQVQGTYSANVTLTAENDIVITGSTTRASGSEALLGLISNNFIRVSHPTTAKPAFTVSHSTTTVTGVSSSCTNSGGPGSIQIDAAILSLTHSFIVDNYYCGSPLGTLSVNGAIIQAYRGAVGTGGSTIATGYVKNYTYDDRLKYRSPPKFLDPVAAGWAIQTYNEQIPAR